MKIAPDNPAHQQLEKDAMAFLHQRGFLTAALPYHDRLPPTIAALLKTRCSPTALYLRSGADRIAVHSELPIEFEWEAKTHLSSRQDDLCLEVLPLMHHSSKAKLGVRCLYVCRLPWGDVGFWCQNIPRIREIWIPARSRLSNSAVFRAAVSAVFPGVDIRNEQVRGSGDPFAVVDADLAKTRLLNWRRLIDEKVLN